MIKYVDLPGYQNVGELALFSHLYEFIEPLEKEPRKLILVHAYEVYPAKVFKGYVLDETRTYESIPLTAEEKSKIEPATGDVTQVDFKELIKGTIAEEYYKEYGEMKKTE